MYDVTRRESKSSHWLIISQVLCWDGNVAVLAALALVLTVAFEHVTSWLDDLRTHAEENCSIILVANKTDLCSNTPTALPQIQFGEAVSPSDVDPVDPVDPEETPSTPTSPSAASASASDSNSNSASGSGLLPRAVSTLEGAFFAKQHGLLYVETSAKEGWGVVDAFEWTARQMLERIEQGQVDRKAKTVELGKGRSGAKGGCC